MHASPSVFVAEVATLALGATLLNKMELIHVNFFTDNQLLAHCINASDHADILDWRAAPYTWIISSSLTGAYKVCNISRDQNHMADSLAKQGLAFLQSNHLPLGHSCTNPSHVHGFPLLRVLQFVTIDSVMVLTTS
jgi:hypothetical protein